MKLCSIYVGVIALMKEVDEFDLDIYYNDDSATLESFAHS